MCYRPPVNDGNFVMGSIFKKKPVSAADKAKTQMQATFNRASKVFSALKALEKKTDGKIRVLACTINDYGHVMIKTNIPGAFPYENLTLAVWSNIDSVSSLGAQDKSSLSTVAMFRPGIKSRWALNKTVSYVRQQAKAHGMI